MLSAACGGNGGEEPVRTAIVFKHGKLFGDPAALNALIAEFESANPGIDVRDETLPAGTDEQHQFYVINLSAGSSDFDVFAIDVIWVQEFARAGWLVDVSELWPPGMDTQLFSAAVRAVTYRGRRYAIPWYMDAGLLYYRRDLLRRYGFEPPRTWTELVTAAKAIGKGEGIYGFVWQGRQSEGLVCNALEYLWSNGGEVEVTDGLSLDTPANREALGFMRRLVTEFGITPAFVTTLTEEPSRRIFGDGRAVFLRNWPYAWNLFQQEGSAVRGKVGVAPLPHFTGHESAATLGGWQIAVNPNSRHRAAAKRFLRFITSKRVQRRLALAYGFKPAWRELYDDAELLQRQPFLGLLPSIYEQTRPRPLTPHYVSISQTLQAQFSAVVAGVRGAGEALARAERQVGEAMR